MALSRCLTAIPKDLRREPRGESTERYFARSTPLCACRKSPQQVSGDFVARALGMKAYEASQSVRRGMPVTYWVKFHVVANRPPYVSVRLEPVKVPQARRCQLLIHHLHHHHHHHHHPDQRSKRNLAPFPPCCDSAAFSRSPKEGVRSSRQLSKTRKTHASSEDPKEAAVIVAGDFNLLDTDGDDAPVMHFLRNGHIGKSYSYRKLSGAGGGADEGNADLIAAGTEGAAGGVRAEQNATEDSSASSFLEYTSKKAKRHPFGGIFRDAAVSLGQARPTFIAPDLFAKFKLDGERFTRFYSADAIFAQCASSAESKDAEAVMDADGIEVDQ